MCVLAAVRFQEKLSVGLTIGYSPNGAGHIPVVIIDVKTQDYVN